MSPAALNGLQARCGTELPQPLRHSQRQRSSTSPERAWTSPLLKLA